MITKLSTDQEAKFLQNGPYPAPPGSMADVYDVSGVRLLVPGSTISTLLRALSCFALLLPFDFLFIVFSIAVIILLNTTYKVICLPLQVMTSTTASLLPGTRQ